MEPKLKIRYVVCNMKHSEDGKLIMPMYAAADIQLLSETQSAIPMLLLSLYQGFNP
jgi:hypothetical protein